jgi:hypothetical protein
MTRLIRRRRSANGPARTLAADAEVARLTARADLIVEELDVVVKQMSEMLRNAPGKAL